MKRFKAFGRNEENQEQPSLLSSQALWRNGRYTFTILALYSGKPGPTLDPEACHSNDSFLTTHNRQPLQTTEHRYQRTKPLQLRVQVTFYTTALRPADQQILQLTLRHKVSKLGHKS